MRRLPALCALLLLLPGIADAGRRARDGDDDPVPWDHAWLEGAVFYEVFVRSFADSDGDGIGDLRGLIDRLDYLNDGDPGTGRDLGVDGLWLMPIFPSPSYHGYDVTDYEDIEPDYGTLADFERLIDEADRRGIAVILDLVVNHTSSAHPWFQDAAASGRLRNWYVWRKRNPGWKPPWGGSAPTWHPSPVDGTFYYGVFWSGMPDLNFRARKVRKEVARLAELWLGRGAAGFRLDASRYLVEAGPGPRQADTARTHAVWKELSAAVRRLDPRTLLLGENWANAETIATYYGDTDDVRGGDELPASFNFPLAEGILDAVGRGRARPVLAAMEEVARHYPAGVLDAPFLTNHDQQRLATRLGGRPEKLRLAASLLLTLPGVPFLYYGEEVGLANGPSGDDRDKRTPMPWEAGAGVGFTSGTPWHPPAPGSDTANVAGQVDRPGSLLDHYRRLIDVRGASRALGAGGFAAIDVGRSPLALYTRFVDGERVLVAVNLGGGFELAGPIPEPGRPLELLYGDAGSARPSGSPGRWSLPMPPHSTAIWRFSSD